MNTTSDGLMFSIVVPTYNRPEHIPALLKSLADQEFPSRRFEVILADDGGSDELAALISPFKDLLQIKLLKLAHGGCAAARQAGTGVAMGQYIAFTDDDCRPGRNWLSSIASVLAEHGEWAIGGPIRNRLARNPFSEASQIVVNTLVLSGMDDSGFLKYCPTNNLVFPAEAFRMNGGLDPDWPIGGGEDRELCADWINAGRKIMFLPVAEVAHLSDLSLHSFLRQHFNYGRGSFLFHQLSPGNSARHYSYERWKYYLQLPIASFHGRTLFYGAEVSAAVLLSQIATAAGFAAQALRRLLHAGDSAVGPRIQPNKAGMQ